MTHAEMMAEMLAARRELAHALEMLAQAIGGLARGGHGGNGGNKGGAAVSGDLVLTRISLRRTHPRSRRLLSLWMWSIGFVF